jgi:hypothetical protein
MTADAESDDVGEARRGDAATPGTADDAMEAEGAADPTDAEEADGADVADATDLSDAEEVDGADMADAPEMPGGAVDVRAAEGEGSGFTAVGGASGTGREA